MMIAQKGKEMKTINRTIITSRIYASAVKMEKGEIKMDDFPFVEIDDDVNNVQVLKIVRNTYGKENQYVIRAIQKTANVYSIPVEDFVKYATLVSVNEIEEAEN